MLNGQISHEYLDEALVRWQRGDALMMLYYLDKAGFVGIEAFFAPFARLPSAA